MNKTTMAALLGRPLSTIENTNYNLYLKIARDRLQQLTCLDLEEVTEDRVYSVRESFHSVFTDMFTGINSVTLNGTALEATDYTPMQWDRRKAEWFNSIVLDCLTTEDEITINADWGACTPGLQLLQAKLFDLIGKMNTGSGNVKSKKVEDFSITFNDNTVYDQFLLDNGALIAQYSICNVPQLTSGRVCRIR